MLQVHCYGHKNNLFVKTLSDLEIVLEIEDLVKVIHIYYAHSPKKYTKFHYLAFLMETKGLKLLKNMCTKWCSLITPFRRLLMDYPTLMAKMRVDKDDKKWSKNANVSFHLYPFSS